MRKLKFCLMIISLMLMLFCNFLTTYLKANDNSNLLLLKSIDKKGIIYTLNDNIVHWDNDKVVMFDFVFNRNIETFSISDFAKDYKQDKLTNTVSNPLSFVDGQMFQFNSNGLCCYDPKTGKRLWNNIEMLPQRYYQYYNPVVSNNGILYIIKRHDNRSDIPPLLFCIDSKDGKIVNQQSINTDKFNAKYKNIINCNAQIIAIYNNKLIIYPQGYYFYCYNVQTSEIEWVSEIFLPSRWSTPKYTVIDDLLVFRQELDDPTVEVPPCTIDDYYAPGVGVYSLKDGIRLFFKKAHDFVIKGNSLFLFKFSECSNDTNFIEQYELPGLKLAKNYQIPYKIKFTYGNLECTTKYDGLVYFTTQDNETSYRLASFDLDQFSLKSSITVDKKLNVEYVSKYIYRRIYSTDNFMLIITKEGSDLYCTKKRLFVLLSNIIKKFIKP